MLTNDGPITALAVSKGGHVLSGSEEGTVKMLDVL
jgi:hypothetical protein